MRGAMARVLWSARMYDGTAPTETVNHGPGRIGGMGQREDVERSLAREEGHDRREVYGRRRGELVGVRAGWRARLAHIESTLAGATTTLVNVRAREPDAAFMRGALGDLRRALAEIREMLDEVPQIGVSQRAPIEVQPVRESER